MFPQWILDDESFELGNRPVLVTLLHDYRTCSLPVPLPGHLAKDKCRLPVEATRNNRSPPDGADNSPRRRPVP